MYNLFQCENSSESEQLIWFLKSQILHIIELSTEPPVQELIALLHRSPDYSDAMLTAVEEICIPLNKVINVMNGYFFLRNHLVKLEVISIISSLF